MPIKIDTIIEQMEWAASRGLTEFSVTASGTEIRISRSAGALPSPASAETPAAPAVLQPDPAQTIDAPMAGICHLSGESGGSAFVSAGDRIEVGQTICLIEAMKVMTSVPAAHSGTIKAVLVEDGDNVGAGTPLFEVQP